MWIAFIFSHSFYDNRSYIWIWDGNQQGKRLNLCLDLTCEECGAKVCPSARAGACRTARDPAFSNSNSNNKNDLQKKLKNNLIVLFPND